MENKCIVILVLLMFFTPVLINAQVKAKKENKKSKKNSLRIFIEPALTKSNFDLTKPAPSSTEENWYKSKKPNKPLESTFYGVEYSRILSQKHSISLIFRHTEKGQKSPHYFTSAGSGENIEDYPSGYGGRSYEIRVVGEEIILSYGYTFFENKIFSTTLKTGLSLDNYYNNYIRNFLIRRDTGNKESGCCIISYEYDQGGGYFKKLKSGFKNGRIRFGATVSVAFDFKIFQNIYFNLQPELEYLAKLNKQEDDFFWDGSIFVAGVQLGVGYRF